MGKEKHTLSFYELRTPGGDNKPSPTSTTIHPQGLKTSLTPCIVETTKNWAARGSWAGVVGKHTGNVIRELLDESSTNNNRKSIISCRFEVGLEDKFERLRIA
jgi:hypothetical protein